MSHRKSQDLRPPGLEPLVGEQDEIPIGAPIARIQG